MESKIGRPKVPENQRRVRESVYLEPEVRQWLKERSELRHASISSLINVIVRERMKKEKERT